MTWFESKCQPVTQALVRPQATWGTLTSAPQDQVCQRLRLTNVSHISLISQNGSHIVLLSGPACV